MGRPQQQDEQCDTYRPAKRSDDIDRLTRALKEQRQANRERAQYYRMQEEEDAILAIAAARDYDSDE